MLALGVSFDIYVVELVGLSSSPTTSRRNWTALSFLA
jgi:hypothetical protein